MCVCVCLCVCVCGCVCVRVCACVCAGPTLAGQRVVADDGDAEALPVLLDERNLVDLVSLQVGLKPRTCLSSR